MEKNEGIIVQRGNLTGRQIVVGRGASATYTETAASALGADEVAALRDALKELRAELAGLKLPEDTQIALQTSAGRALLEGVKDDRVEPQALEQHVHSVGTTLKEAGVVVEEGSALWMSIRKLLPLLGPVVGGGARVAAAWFGVPV